MKYWTFTIVTVLTSFTLYATADYLELTRTWSVFLGFVGGTSIMAIDRVAKELKRI